MVRFILIKSPDEWATTKQACRDELVVYLFFSPIYSSLYLYVLSTVLRISSFTLYIFIYIYLTVILRGRAGYELIHITNEASKSEKNNCFSKYNNNIMN